MCPIQEESTDPKMDLLSIEPSHCAEQLTIMDAVSKFCGYSVSLHSKCFQSSYCAKVRAGAEKKKKWKGEQCVQVKQGHIQLKLH